jgi:hypothetical protein
MEPQTVTVTILGQAKTFTLTIPGQGRIAQELGAWQLDGEFGVQVRCGSVCAASLTMWNAGYTYAHESVPLTGCQPR